MVRGTRHDWQIFDSHGGDTSSNTDVIAKQKATKGGHDAAEYSCKGRIVNIIVPAAHIDLVKW